jgi:hypothetical protein
MRRISCLGFLLAVFLGFVAHEAQAVRPSREFSDPNPVGNGGQLGDDDLPDKGGLLSRSSESFEAAHEGNRPSVAGPQPFVRSDTWVSRNARRIQFILGQMRRILRN